MKCPNCQFEFKTVGQTNFVCSRCAHRWRDSEGAPTGEESDDTAAERRRWRIWFWLLFLLGPVVTFLALRMPMDSARVSASWLQPMVRQSGFRAFSMLAPLFAAAFGAAFCLVRSRRRETSRAERITSTILLAIGLLVAYAGIAFAGCMIAMSAAR